MTSRPHSRESCDALANLHHRVTRLLWLMLLVLFAAAITLIFVITDYISHKPGAGVMSPAIVSPLLGLGFSATMLPIFIPLINNAEKRRYERRRNRHRSRHR